MKPRDTEQHYNNKKRCIYESINALYEGTEMVLNTLKSGIFQSLPKEGSGLKISTYLNALKITNSTCTSKSR